ncbi:MAG: beta-L-arabinofuranosidase domain-containing protein [Bacteroidaceae bacterium]
MMIFAVRLSMATFLALGLCSSVEARKKELPQPVPYSQVVIDGALSARVEQNMKRLEEEKYRPQNVFLTEEQSGDWPGDTEGRTILALTLDAQASHRTPRHLEEIIRLVPSHLNARGYMGTIHSVAHEQQLSGNGWMLRALCEYYLWKKDESVRQVIGSIARNLFLPLTGQFACYPVDPQDRVQGQGAESGNIVASQDGWMLSTDVGCVFIGMEGLIQAYAILGDEDLKEPIETLLNRFLQIDLTGIKAQTHATLTACRGLMRYAELTGNRRWVEEAETRFLIYIRNGMTENMENYNWFERFDTWTEPCAIVDSYMLAVQLWQQTRKPEYLEIAEQIYYNAICHTQRYNGGFGCDNCPGKATDLKRLKVSVPEAHWCCTMRGGEGLSSAVHYTCFSAGREVWIPFFRSGQFSVPVSRGVVSLDVRTSYPFEGCVELRVKEAASGKMSLHLAAPSWISNARLSLNGEEVKVGRQDGFLVLNRGFRSGDVILLRFDMPVRVEKTLNEVNMEARWHRVFAGPLLLGNDGPADITLPQNPEWERTGEREWMLKGSNIKFTPVYHLMDQRVWTGTDYSKQILF